MKPTDLNEANWRSGGGVSLCCARWEGAIWSCPDGDKNGRFRLVTLLPEGNSWGTKSNLLFILLYMLNLSYLIRFQRNLRVQMGGP